MRRQQTARCPVCFYSRPLVRWALWSGWHSKYQIAPGERHPVEALALSEQPHVLGVRQRFPEPRRAVLLQSLPVGLIAVQKVFLEVSKEQAVTQFWCFCLHLAGCWFCDFHQKAWKGEREPSSSTIPSNYLSKGWKCSRGNSSRRWLTEAFRTNPTWEAACVCECAGLVSAWHHAAER